MEQDIEGIAYDLFDSIHTLNRQLECQFRDRILSPSEAAILRCLSGGQRLPCEIARSCHLSPALTSKSIKKLMGLGFVETAKCDYDKRSVVIRLTKNGQQKAAVAKCGIEKQLSRNILNKLTDEEILILNKATVLLIQLAKW